MTTPTIETEMLGYGVPVRTRSTDRMCEIAPQHRNYKIVPDLADRRVALPEGVSHIQASYSGAAAAQLYWDDGESGYKLVETIPANSGGVAFNATRQSLHSHQPRLRLASNSHAGASRGRGEHHHSAVPAPHAVISGVV